MAWHGLPPPHWYERTQSEIRDAFNGVDPSKQTIRPLPLRPEARRRLALLQAQKDRDVQRLPGLLPQFLRTMWQALRRRLRSFVQRHGRGA